MTTGTITAVGRGSIESDISVYDLARWKPITPEEYVREMSRIAADLNDGVFETETETLPDGRTRLSLNTDVVASVVGAKSGYSPYLTVLYDPETDKSTTFRRTDVRLELDSHRVTHRS